MIIHEYKLLEDFVKWRPFEIPKKGVIMVGLRCEAKVIEKIQRTQQALSEFPSMLVATHNYKSKLKLSESGLLKFKNLFWVPYQGSLRNKFMEEAHG